MSRAWFVSAAAAALFALVSPAGAATSHPVEGVQFDNEVRLGSSRLLLNGAGVRTRLGFKIYVAGLYLPVKADTTDAVLEVPGPRRFSFVLLREIDPNDLGKLFTNGIQANSTREEFAKTIPGIAKIGEMFASRRRLLAGDVFHLDWVPEQGTVITINGLPMGDPIREPEFYNALLKIWLGKKPVDESLKNSLLGRKSGL